MFKASKRIKAIILKGIGPLHEQTLALCLLLLQVVSCSLAYYLRL